MSHETHTSGDQIINDIMAGLPYTAAKIPALKRMVYLYQRRNAFLMARCKSMAQLIQAAADGSHPTAVEIVNMVRAHFLPLIPELSDHEIPDTIGITPATEGTACAVDNH